VPPEVSPRGADIERRALDDDDERVNNNLHLSDLLLLRLPPADREFQNCRLTYIHKSFNCALVLA
jgi:hypothetical protein